MHFHSGNFKRIKYRVESCFYACQELFDKQSEEYKNKILENDSLIVSIEAGTVCCWKKYLKKRGYIYRINEFGKSAPYKEIYEEMNLTPNKIVSIIQKKLRK